MAKTSEGAERDERVTQGGLSGARDLHEVWRHEQRRGQGTDSGRISSGVHALSRRDARHALSRCDARLSRAERRVPGHEKPHGRAPERDGFGDALGQRLAGLDGARCSSHAPHLQPAARAHAQRVPLLSEEASQYGDKDARTADRV